MTQPAGEAGSPAWRDLEAAALLEHARWIGSDLAQRLDAMTQRAGVLLAATLALGAWRAGRRRSQQLDALATDHREDRADLP